MRQYFLQIRLFDKYDGRKIWYMNDYYFCDCKNQGFTSKSDAIACVPDVKRKFGSRIESIKVTYSR